MVLHAVVAKVFLSWYLTFRDLVVEDSDLDKFRQLATVGLNEIPPRISLRIPPENSSQLTGVSPGFLSVFF